MSDSTSHPGLVFYDTDVLIAAGWPNPSAQLLQQLDHMDRVNITYCLTEVVRTELVEKTIRLMAKDYTEAANKYQKVQKKKVRTVQAFPKLPSEDSLRNEIESMTSAFTARFTLIPTTSRPLSEFVTLATKYRATFEENDKGFKDAVILCSILDFMKEQQVFAAVVVSRDGVFGSPAATSFWQSENAKLEVLESIDELAARISNYVSHELNAAWAAHEEEDRQKLLTTVEPLRSDLETYIVENLAVSSSDLSVQGVVKQIKRLELLSIEGVHAALAANEEGDVNVSIDAKIKLELDVQTFTLSPPPKLKVGGTAQESAPTVDIYNLFGTRAIHPKEAELVVVVEADAKRTDEKFHDIRFTSVSVKKPPLFTLSGLLPSIQS